MGSNILRAAVAAIVLVSPLAAAAQLSVQSGQAATLTLEEAHRLARQNNPSLQQSMSSSRSANAAVRTAYGGFLPSVSASFGTSYQQGGRQVLSGAELGASSDVIQSSYSIGISHRISALTFLNPRIQKANRDAVEADIDGAVSTLQMNITTRYLSILQAEARAALQDSLLKSAQLQLDLARARTAVGAAIILDVQRAEIALGQVEVARIRERNAVEIEKLNLFRDIGMMLPISTRLTTSFRLEEPRLSLDTLLATARVGNPGVVALRSREKVSDLGVKRARSEYLPSFGISTGLGGYTYQYQDVDFLVQRGRANIEGARESCFTNDSLRVGAGMPSIAAQCNALNFTSEQEAQIRAGNRQYPFDFTRNPRSISASISLPIFDGFGREQRMQDASIARDNARDAVRARELAVTADVTASYLTLAASFRAAQLQEQNAAKALQELQFVLERYRVGSATFVEVSDSRALYERAESDRINALYEYHKVFAALEGTVGRPLR